MATLSLKKSTPRVEQIREEQARSVVQIRKDRDATTWQWLVDTWPDLFGNPSEPVPLAIGIRKQLQQIAPEGSRKSVARALGRWTRRKSYQDALISGGLRYGLAGPGSVVTPEQQAMAAREHDQRAKSSRATTTP